MSTPSLPLLALALVTLPSIGRCELPVTGSDYPIRYGNLEDRGHSAEEALQNERRFKIHREKPAVRYLTQSDLPHPEKAGSAAQETVEIKLVERAGVSQKSAPVSFTLPFKQGAIYRLDAVKVNVHPNTSKERELPIQTHALALWPDGSLKSVLVLLPIDLEANATQPLTVQFGHEVRRRAKSPGNLRLRKEADRWSINTGEIEVSLSPSAFAPPGKVQSAKGRRPILAESEGLQLVDAQGQVFRSNTAPLDTLTVERGGPLELVLRAEGSFQNGKGDRLMRQITRLRFLSGSARVEMTTTIVNDALAHEFTDITSLSLPLAFPDHKEWEAKIDRGDAPSLEGAGELALRQWDEHHQGEGVRARAPGGAFVKRATGTFAFGYRDFWQRWPKGLKVAPGRFSVELLPQQDTPLEKELPVHLQFPFVEGYYRTKWGTAFTERMTFDFQPKEAASTLTAELQKPPHVIIPPEYLRQSGVYSAIPPVNSERASRWVAYVDQAMRRFLEHRDHSRAYGYLNWGDWFGERGRNWGNNEYDLPHGLFIHYLLSGNPDFLDAAIAGVRHQADVDIIHAYPDRFYIGGNLQHSIGHSGISYQKVTPATWSYLYDNASAGVNGHTWADGMADAWLLTGDPVVMEAMLSLAEHLRWAAIPSLQSMGNHHRSAGWLAIAAAATFRATSDPAYLEGLQQLMRLPLNDWDPKTGIWPYELHPGHTGGRKGLVGASVYNMGILMMGISRYHELTGDPKAKEVLTGAAQWLEKSWSEDRAWPYAALSDGTLFRPGVRPGLNPLLYPPLAYAAKITGRAEWQALAAKAYDVTFATPIDEKLPKDFSIKMQATPWALSLLETQP